MDATVPTTVTFGEVSARLPPMFVQGESEEEVSGFKMHLHSRGRESVTKQDPLHGLRYQKKKHNEWKNTKTKDIVFEEEALHLVVKDLEDEVAMDSCLSQNGVHKRCTCLHPLRLNRGSLRACANAILLDYHTLGTSVLKDRHLQEKIRYANAFALEIQTYTEHTVTKKYLLPFRARDAPEPGNDVTHHQMYICADVFFRSLYSIGNHRRRRLLKNDPKIPMKLSNHHGNSNATERLVSAKISLHSFLSNLEKQAEPISMRLLTTKCGVTSR